MSYYFCLMISGSGSRRPKNIRIRILNTAKDTCCILCTGPEPGFEPRDRERVCATCDEPRGCRHPRTDLQGCQATLLLSLLFSHTTLFFRPFFFLSLVVLVYIYMLIIFRNSKYKREQNGINLFSSRREMVKICSHLVSLYVE